MPEEASWITTMTTHYFSSGLPAWSSSQEHPKPQDMLSWLDQYGLTTVTSARYQCDSGIVLYHFLNQTKAHSSLKEKKNSSHLVLQSNIICQGRPRKQISDYFSWGSSLLNVLKKHSVCVCVCVRARALGRVQYHFSNRQHTPWDLG